VSGGVGGEGSGRGGWNGMGRWGGVKWKRWRGWDEIDDEVAGERDKVGAEG
jgi:hypothetical protein